MATVTICSDFEAQENEIFHCFHFSPFYLPWNYVSSWSLANSYFFFFFSLVLPLLDWHMHVCMLSCFSHVWLFVTLWTLAHVSVVHGVPQARMLECVAMPSSSGMEVIFLTQKSNQHPLWFLPCRILYHWSTGEAKKSQKWIYIIFRHFYLTYLTMYFWVSKYFVACNSK